MDSPAGMFQNPTMTLIELPPLTSEEEAALLLDLEMWTSHIQNIQRGERQAIARLATCPPQEREWEVEQLAFTRRTLRLLMERRHKTAQRLGIGDNFLPTLQN